MKSFLMIQQGQYYNIKIETQRVFNFLTYRQSLNCTDQVQMDKSTLDPTKPIVRSKDFSPLYL